MKLLSKLVPAALFLSVNLFSEDPKQFLLHEMNQQDFVEIFQNKDASCIIKVETGTHLPVNLEASGSIFSIEHSKDPVTTIVVNKPLYVKIDYSKPTVDCSLCEGMESEEPKLQMEFSQDQITWKSFEECFTGNIFAGISTDESETAPTAKVSIDFEFKN